VCSQQPRPNAVSKPHTGGQGPPPLAGLSGGDVDHPYAVDVDAERSPHLPVIGEVPQEGIGDRSETPVDVSDGIGSRRRRIAGHRMSPSRSSARPCRVEPARPSPVAPGDTYPRSHTATAMYGQPASARRCSRSGRRPPTGAAPAPSHLWGAGRASVLAIGAHALGTPSGDRSRDSPWDDATDRAASYAVGVRWPRTG
jgi:hypothetical protein